MGLKYKVYTTLQKICFAVSSPKTVGSGCDNVEKHQT